MTQTSVAGGTSLGVTWSNAHRVSDSVDFSVASDSHSESLGDSDFSRISILRNDRGQQVTPIYWTVLEGGHHGSGSLGFPNADAAGKLMIEPGVRYIELVVRGFAGAKERVSRWDISW